MQHVNLNISIKVKPATLITALQKNKSKHLEDYQKAVVVYFEDLEKRIKSLLEKAQEKDIKYQYYLSLPIPINNEKLYDKYIGMFAMAINETIEISSVDYGCIVDDNWDWSVSASTINALYSSKYAG